jgi:serine/threonine protein phosphatase PrpC
VVGAQLAINRAGLCLNHGEHHVELALFAPCSVAAGRNTTRLVTANIGDARTVLVRGGQPIQLSVDHVPDNVDERDRIERFNPNPRMPLVRAAAGGRCVVRMTLLCHCSYALARGT